MDVQTDGWPSNIKRILLSDDYFGTFGTIETYSISVGRYFKDEVFFFSPFTLGMPLHFISSAHDDVLLMRPLSGRKK